MIEQLLTDYRYQTEFIMMFGGIGLLAYGWYLIERPHYGQYLMGIIIAMIGALSAIIGTLLCLISLMINGS